jgi:hypothetical protein
VAHGDARQRQRRHGRARDSELLGRGHGGASPIVADGMLPAVKRLQALRNIAGRRRDDRLNAPELWIALSTATAHLLNPPFGANFLPFGGRSMFT